MYIENTVVVSLQACVNGGKLGEVEDSCCLVNCEVAWTVRESGSSLVREEGGGRAACELYCASPEVLCAAGAGL